MRYGDEYPPLLDARHERFRQAVFEPGAKTRLAEHLATLRGQPAMTWKIIISRILAHTRVPAGEKLLAITAWMDAMDKNQTRHRR